MFRYSLNFASICWICASVQYRFWSTFVKTKDNRSTMNTYTQTGVSCTRLPDNSIICASPASLESHLTRLAHFEPAYTSLGDEQELALLFLDIRNFTDFMEARSSYDVIYVIRKLFALFNESIKASGGRIIETMGDSIYAVFGLNSNLKEAMQAAVNASSSIFEDLEVFNTGYAQPYFNSSFEIGIGLHQGKVVVGEYNMNFICQ